VLENDYAGRGEGGLPCGKSEKGYVDLPQERPGNSPNRPIRLDLKHHCHLILFSNRHLLIDCFAMTYWCLTILLED